MYENPFNYLKCFHSKYPYWHRQTNYKLPSLEFSNIRPPTNKKHLLILDPMFNSSLVVPIVKILMMPRFENYRLKYISSSML